MTVISTIYARRNIKAMKSLSSCFNKDINKIKINTNNSFVHELTKFIVAYKLINAEHDVITEAIFKNRKRADVFDLTNNIIYEILNTERESNIELKQKLYPAPIVALHCRDLNFVGSTNSLLNSFEKEIEL
jgi:hypothetical protein